MSLDFTSQLNDPDLDRVLAALLRAGQRARELARQSGTGIAPCRSMASCASWPPSRLPPAFA
jgi:hypothetical protein